MRLIALCLIAVYFLLATCYGYAIAAAVECLGVFLLATIALIVGIRGVE